MGFIRKAPTRGKFIKGPACSIVMSDESRVEAQYIFYIIGIVFLFATVAYFSYEYLFSLSDVAKTAILTCLVVVFFVMGSVMSERGI